MSYGSSANILAQAACRLGISRLPSKYAYTASLIADAAGLLAVAGVVQHGQVAASPPTDMVDVHRVPFRSAWA